ncbi:MAG: hypothetical protein ACLFR2_06715 [Candidatus Kapaibacterium sp.]
MARRMTRVQIAQRPKDLTQYKYEHGGSRIFVDGEVGDRQLLVDTYYDTDFAEHIEKCTREYFGLPTEGELEED